VTSVAGRRRRSRLCAGTALRLLLALSAGIGGGIAQGQERITEFHSRIAVAEDGGLTVTETIQVDATGYRIRHGIYRDFPTTYPGPWGTRVEVPFEVVSVERDSVPEPFHLEPRVNGVRIYFGREDLILSPGHYTYALTYRTARQLGFFADRTELYWNVTGNDWVFPIDQASANVALPASVPIDQVTVSGYTGPVGSTAQRLMAAVNRVTGQLQFATKTRLAPGEGLTIVASFPNGLIQPPSRLDNLIAFVRANPTLLIGAAGLVMLALYYLSAWVAVGRDPTRGTIIPLFQPPPGLEPAALRYVERMGYDRRCMAAALVSLAVKGWARIEEAAGAYSLVRRDGRRTPLGAGEQQVNETLLASGSFAVTRQNHATVRAAINGLRGALRREHEGTLFLANRRWLIRGVSFAALIVVGAGVAGTLGRGMGPELLLATTWMWTVPLLLGLVVVHIPFAYLLKQPTDAGRTVMDQISGFRMYLTTAAGAELAAAAPARTPQLFEQLLPCAVALGVENAWADQFSDVFETAARDPHADHYTPDWYRGDRWDARRTPSFATAVGASFASAIQAASSAPGSRSGGSGGSSGGGGGGGGGGGW